MPPPTMAATPTATTVEMANKAMFRTTTVTTPSKMATHASYSPQQWFVPQQTELRDDEQLCLLNCIVYSLDEPCQPHHLQPPPAPPVPNEPTTAETSAQANVNMEWQSTATHTEASEDKDTPPSEDHMSTMHAPQKSPELSTMQLEPHSPTAMSCMTLAALTVLEWQTRTPMS